MTLGVKWESSGKTGKDGECANNVFFYYYFYCLYLGAVKDLNYSR